MQFQMFTNPIWVVKTRLCLQYGTGPPTVAPAIAGNGKTFNPKLFSHLYNPINY